LLECSSISDRQACYQLRTLMIVLADSRS
jgi:hypothetical protein